MKVKDNLIFFCFLNHWQKWFSAVWIHFNVNTIEFLVSIFSQFIHRKLFQSLLITCAIIYLQNVWTQLCEYFYEEIQKKNHHCKTINLYSRKFKTDWKFFFFPRRVRANTQWLLDDWFILRFDNSIIGTTGNAPATLTFVSRSTFKAMLILCKLIENRF